ncbi:potassium efflux system protein [Cricetibacter osteomyelitidis]|uniref:Potassium efflux system protein n=1 Tax=Cricetibacter osteomyelitidis TaxID=1521931 RepID=A0A4R2T5H6_9PAST|nr:mechanosensitive channel MscK [Cricetibacter osteomyelitidis]TCP97670.1 potassium efflux system protein [Cricetibacter osteomyelitidis]
MKLLYRTILAIYLTFVPAFSVGAESLSLPEIPTVAKVTALLNEAKAGNSNSAESQATIKTLEETLQLTKEITQQQQLNETLAKDVAKVPSMLAQSQANITKLRQQSAVNFQQNLVNQTLEALQKQLETEQSALDQVQESLIEINTKVSSQNTVVERVQTSLKENLIRSQDLVRLWADATTKAQKTRLQLEQTLIELRDTYNQSLLQENDKLRFMYETQAEEKSLQQQILQRKIIALQEAINEKNLQASQRQVTQATQLEQKNNGHPLISRELAINTKLSQDLLQQTTQMNNLSQDSLRSKSLLDNLKQTQHYIEDQLNMLQGTLLLSRVINELRQDLPKEQMVQGLAKRITDLRVQVFETTKMRDSLSDPQSYIDTLQTTEKVTLNEKERSQLAMILQERSEILTSQIRSLNNQLNLAINVDLNQQQVLSISDALQAKLQQQSFWVKSNSPIDLDWVKSFPNLALWEFKELSKTFDLSQITQNLFSLIAIGALLLFTYMLIIWEKSAIKARLEVLATYVNTLKNDSHWHTPEALLWTVVLALPNALIFFAIVGFGANIIFVNKFTALLVSGILFIHWLFFSTVLSLLRPHGIAYRHFGMPPESNEVFREVIGKSIIVFVLFVISFGFSYIEQVDYSNDVIGEVISLIALIMCQFVILPLFNKAIRKYENTVTENGEKRNTKWMKLLRVVLVVIPISLMFLITLGYYYTAVTLTKHLLNCYLLVIAWIFARQVVYRIFTVSSRRMAYRRLKEKREQIRQQKELGEEKVKELLEAEEKNSIKISTVNQQLFRMADLVGWVVLLFCFYLIWSDLISVAYYLDGVILWESVDSSNNVDSITLLNLMRSLLILLGMYAIIRNLEGILEVLIFSRGKFVRGMSHTATAILRYVMILIGSIWSFSNLGLSWTKIQWIFTALSVGLGFGVREIFGSFISGLILLFERPVRVGDKVTVGQYTGTVTQIRLRSTTLIDSDDKDIVLPNQAFVTDRFINWTLSNTMTRIVIPVEVAYGSDLDLVAKLLRQVADEAPKVAQDQDIKVNFLAFGKSGLEYELQVHVPELDDRMPTTNFINYRINQLFERHGIKIATERMEINLPEPIQTQA